MGVEVKLPIIVQVDNVGAMFIAKDVTMSQHTKHIDIHYQYVHEFVMDGFMKIVFV